MYLLEKWQNKVMFTFIFRHLSHLGSIRQQLEHRKIAQFRIVDVLERQEAPNDAVKENRGTSSYIAAFAWPRGRCKRPNSKIVPGKLQQTNQEAEIAYTGFAAASNDAKTQCSNSVQTNFGGISIWHPSPRIGPTFSSWTPTNFLFKPTWFKSSTPTILSWKLRRNWSILKVDLETCLWNYETHVFVRQDVNSG